MGAEKFLKICGIRNLHEAEFCEGIGVGMLGLNFVDSSRRRISEMEAKKIADKIKQTQLVGVFQNQELEYVNLTAERFDLDFIQLSGDEGVDYVKSCVRPVIKGFGVGEDFSPEETDNFRGLVKYLLFDGMNPGCGEAFDWSVLQNVKQPFLVAGGVNEDNVRSIISSLNPDGVDVASGAETLGHIDLGKIFSLWEEVRNF